MRKERLFKVYELLVDGPGQGPAGDGTYIVRFLDRQAAERFAKSATTYGRPCVVRDAVEVPKRLYNRWTFAG